PLTSTPQAGQARYRSGRFWFGTPLQHTLDGTVDAPRRRPWYTRSGRSGTSSGSGAPSARATEQSIKMLWATRVAFGGPGSSSSMTATSAASGIEALGALGG